MAQIVRRQKTRRRLPEINEQHTEWGAGYMSYTDPLRMVRNGCADLTNMDITQDGIPESRPGLVPVNTQPIGQVIGIGKYSRPKASGGIETYQVTMQVIDNVGKICINKDDNDWTVITASSYDPQARASFTKLNDRLYVSNRSDKMSYQDLSNNTIVAYSEIPAPAKPTLTATGLTGGTLVYRYRVSANNKVGETQASEAVLVTVPELREAWDPNTQSIKVTATMVTGADSYSFYCGTVAGEETYLGTIQKPASGTTVEIIDNNRAALNPFKKAPAGNSTGGPTLGHLIAADDRLFGIDDKDNPYRLWYSGQGTRAGDFSAYSGGGWVDIDKGSDSVPTALKYYRNGRGDSALTILGRGSASEGTLHHQTFETQTLGNFTITYPVIVRANGQGGTSSSRGVIEQGNSLHYFSGNIGKTTGTKASMINILVTDNTTDTLERDTERINLAAMRNHVGVGYNNRNYWLLPVGSNKNSEIWIQDLARKGIWILRWTIPADDMWLYEDSSGNVHHRVLVNNRILEFTKGVATDDGKPFRQRFAPATYKFDKTALQMASVDSLRMMLVKPMGKIAVNIFGLAEGNKATRVIAEKMVDTKVTPLGWGTFMWSTKVWGSKPPKIENTTIPQLPINIEIGDVVSQAFYEVVTDGPAHIAISSSMLTGNLIPGMYQEEA